MATLRARDNWSTLRAQIRRIINETDPNNSFWSDDLLLDLWNHAMTMRALQMAETHDGYLTLGYVTDVVSGQREYVLPEGTERIRGVWLRYTSGTNTIEELALNRDDLIGEDYYQPGSVTYRGSGGTRPTYRVVENLLSIEPPELEDRTDGLRLEIDALPPQFETDSSKLALYFPLSTEMLLIYDTVLLALGVEDSQGNQDDNLQSHGNIKRFHQRLEATWLDFIQVRNQSRVYGKPFFLGD